MTFQDQVNMLITRVLNRIDEGLPLYGDFIPIIEFFENMDEESQDIVGKYGLKLYKMPQSIDQDPKKRYLEAAAYTPNGSYKADMIVGVGYNNDIVRLLNSEDFPTKLNKIYGELLDCLGDF